MPFVFPFTQNIINSLLQKYWCSWECQALERGLSLILEPPPFQTTNPGEVLKSWNPLVEVLYTILTTSVTFKKGPKSIFWQFGKRLAFPMAVSHVQFELLSLFKNLGGLLWRGPMLTHTTEFYNTKWESMPLGLSWPCSSFWLVCAHNIGRVQPCYQQLHGHQGRTEWEDQVWNSSASQLWYDNCTMNNYLISGPSWHKVSHVSNMDERLSPVHNLTTESCRG